ncbi:diapophytoene dehydrogenase [Mucilaginibacter sp. PAMC 26640]|nr:diapophytoene dehydrogenase [Mucilaginibacter sp. PAMC 26640]
MAKYQLLLPKMGESVAEATVIKWMKNPGDYIEVDEAVMEIATDKVDSEVPSPVSGKLIEQLYEENDVVQVGSVIAVIETEPGNAEQSAINPGAATADSTPAPVTYSETVAADEPVKAPEPAPMPAAIQTPAQENPMSDIPGMSQLAAKEIQLTTTKYDNRFYSPLVKSIATQEGIGNQELDYIPGTGAEGRLTKDDLLAYVQTRTSGGGFKPPLASQANGQHGNVHNYPDVNLSKEPQSSPTQSKASVNITSPEKGPLTEAPAGDELKSASSTEPISVESAKATSTQEVPKIAAAQDSPKPATKPATSVSGGDEIIEMDRMRRLIADHMVYSKHTSPHVTSFVEADVTELVAWRERVKGAFEKREGQKLTFTPIFIEAVVKAIIALPMINVSVSGTQIIKKKNINISMATALPNGNLIVPVIKRADELSLLGIAKSVNDLANRARTGKLLPDDVKDGTFTITNVGSFGNVMGTPIINQPQVAILAVGAIKKKPAVIETPKGDAIAIRHMMFLSLSYDHRVVDGALGGTFVSKVAQYLENWDISRNV